MNTTAPRLKLDIDNWGTFRILKYFKFLKLKKYKGMDSEFVDSTFLSGIPFIGNSVENAGVVKYVEFNPLYKKHKSGCLTMSVATSKNVLLGTYRDKDFYADNINLAVVRIINQKMTENIGQFLISVFALLNEHKYKRNAYNFTEERSKKETINLPQTPTGEPDWDFMEDYIQQLKDNMPCIPEVQEPTLELDIDNWDEFNMIDLFAWERPRGMLIQDTVPGNIPAINASGTNEGVHSLISEVEGYPRHKGNCITRPTDGDKPLASYRKPNEDFIPVAALVIYRLKDKELTREIGLFVTTILRLMSNNFGFLYKLNTTHMKVETIKLPTTPNGTPDWDFMETYIKQIEGN